MKKWIIAIIVIAVIVGGVFGWSTYSSRKAQEAMLAGLQTLEVEIGTLVATIGATGTVRSNQSATLTWQTSGTVESVSAQIGAQVSADQELARLEQTSLPQNVILAQADLVSAEKALEGLKNSQLQQAGRGRSVAYKDQRNSRRVIQYHTRDHP